VKERRSAAMRYTRLTTLLVVACVGMPSRTAAQGVTQNPVRGTPTPAGFGRAAGSAAQGEPRPNGRRLLRSAAVGALSGSLLGMGFYFVSDRGARSSGCQPLDCALPFLSGSGAIAGLFIGRELESQQRALAPRAGASIEFAFSEARTLSSPTYIDVRDSIIAVVSDSGAQLFSAVAQPKALRRRAGGLSAMRQVAIAPGRGTILLGTGSALWETSLISGPATRVADGAVDALATSRDDVLSASGRRLRLSTGRGAASRTDSLELAGLVTAISYDETARAWWVATDSQIVQITGESGALTLTKTVLSLPGGARAIATNGEWIAAALGDVGVIAWRRDAIVNGTATAVLVQQEPRFAYDLAFLDGVLFVAGGVDGLFQLSLTPTPRVVGSSRQVRFATTVRAANGVLWVGDRNRVSVVRVTP
jgi:hypothetical protein